MVKHMNKIWAEQGEIIAEGAFAVAMTLAVMTLRYMIYFL